MKKLNKILKLKLGPLLSNTIGKRYLFISYFSSSKKGWKKFELNNKSIALNIVYVPHNTEEIRHAHKLKYNLKLEDQVIILIITQDEKWHFTAVKNCLHYLQE